MGFAAGGGLSADIAAPQETSKGADPMDTIQIAKYLAVPLAIVPLWAVGQALGNIFATAISSVGRNPACRDQVFPITILGFAMTEAIALFALLIGFLILFS
jgi:F-type H+-transporting ATPase subunit c